MLSRPRKQEALCRISFVSPSHWAWCCEPHLQMGKLRLAALMFMQPAWTRPQLRLATKPVFLAPQPLLPEASWGARALEAGSKAGNSRTLGPLLPDSLSGIILGSVPPRLGPRRRAQMPTGAQHGREGAACWSRAESTFATFLRSPLFVTVKHFSLLKHFNTARNGAGGVAAESPNLPLWAAAFGFLV